MHRGYRSMAAMASPDPGIAMGADLFILLAACTAHSTKNVSAHFAGSDSHAFPWTSSDASVSGYPVHLSPAQALAEATGFHPVRDVCPVVVSTLCGGWLQRPRLDLHLHGFVFAWPVALCEPLAMLSHEPDPTGLPVRSLRFRGRTDLALPPSSAVAFPSLGFRRSSLRYHPLRLRFASGPSVGPLPSDDQKLTQTP